MPKGVRGVGGDKAELEKPLFEMCWFYMGIAQIALDPQPLCQPGKRGKKVPQTILASPYAPPHLRAMPIWKQLISKRGFPYLIFVIFFTRAKFLENKIYTEKRQFFALNL